MKLFGNPFSRNKITVATRMAITPYGKEKAEKSAGEGERYLILNLLSEQGECSATELAKEAHMPVGRVQDILKFFAQSGIVRPLNEERF